MLHKLPLKPIRKRDADVGRILEELRDCYYKSSALGHRYALRAYQQDVYRRIWRSYGTLKDQKRMKRLQKATGRTFRSDTTLASALIQLSAPVNGKVRSEWARVMCKAASMKVPPRKFAATIRDANGQKNFLEGDAGSW